MDCFGVSSWTAFYCLTLGHQRRRGGRNESLEKKVSNNVGPLHLVGLGQFYCKLVTPTMIPVARCVAVNQSCSFLVRVPFNYKSDSSIGLEIDEKTFEF